MKLECSRIFALMAEQVLYTKSDVDIEFVGYQNDSIIDQYVDLISNIYRTSPIMGVAISSNGNASINMGQIVEDVIRGIREKLVLHIAANYPAIAATAGTKHIQAVAGWHNPELSKPAQGMYLVITNDDYCRKAVYYKEDDRWEYADTGKEVEVVVYCQLPAPPAGCAYSDK